MAKRDDIIGGDEVLDEVWHATREGAHAYPGAGDYDAGLDVLGAGLGSQFASKVAPTPPPKPGVRGAGARQGSTVRSTTPSRGSAVKAGAMTLKTTGGAKVASAIASQTSAKVANASSRAIAVGKRLAKFRSRAGAKLIAKGQRASQKATKVHGEVFGLADYLQQRISTFDPVANQNYLDMAANVAAAATAGEIELTLLTPPPGTDGYGALVAQADTLDPALGAAGRAIIDRCEAIINADTDNPDTSIPGQIPGIQADALAWKARLSGAGLAPPTGAAPTPDAGSSGGGGGGGGDDSGAPAGGGADGGDAGTPADAGGPGDDQDGSPSSTSEEVQRFRESGGAYDPFADVADDSEAPDADSSASEDTSNMDDATSAEDDGSISPDQADSGEKVSGALETSDYHFETTDLFLPHTALQRTMKEAEQKAVSQSAAGMTSGTGASAGAVAKPSAAVQQRLTAAQQKLAAVEQRLAARSRAQLAAQAQARSTPATSVAPAASDSASVDPATAAAADAVFGALVEMLGEEEAADLIIDSHTQQITDAEPDVMRVHGAAHRGAAYLDPNYPPHGASQGRQGGHMRPENNIMVFGSDYDNGLDVLGLGPVKAKLVPSKKPVPRLNFVKAKTPRGRTSIAVVPTKGKLLTHEQVVKNARDVSKRGAKIAADLLKHVAKTVKLQAAKVQKAQAANTKVRGDLTDGEDFADGGEDFIGALVAHRAVLHSKSSSGHPTLTLAQIKKIAEDTAASAKKLKDVADKHEVAYKAYRAQVKAGAKVASKKMSPATGTAVHGDDMDADEAHEIVYGALVEVLGDSQGYLPDDPNAAPVDPNATDPNASYDSATGAAGLPGPPDYGVGPAPTIDSVTADLDAAAASEVSGNEVNTYTSLPPGAIVFTGDMWNARTPGFKDVTSYNTYNPNPNADGGQEGGVGAGFEWHGDQGSKWWVYWPANTSSVNPPSDAEKDLDVMYQHSLDHKWGPLLGHGPIWGGLRYLKDGSKTWFFFWKNAPDFAKSPTIQDQYNKAMVDYTTQVAAAKQNYLAQVAQDALDAADAAAQAKQQAKDDAATAHQQEQDQKALEAQAAQQSVIDQSSAQQQQLADEASARQAESQANVEAASYAAISQADTESWKTQALTQAEIDAQAEQTAAEIEQRATETAARLEALRPPAGDGGGDGGDDGGDGGGEDENASETEGSSDTAEAVIGALPAGLRLRLRRLLRRATTG